MPKGTSRPVKQKLKVDVPQKRKRKKGTVQRFVFKRLRPSRKIGSGGVLKKSTSLGRLIRWPKYVQLQRQRKVLLQRLKIPPALNIFRNACDYKFAKKLVVFLQEYKPETRVEKRDRLRAWALLQANGQAPPSTKPNVIQYGFNHVTNLIERGSARLVIIAHGLCLIFFFLCI